jgi:hypothetical protein|tara:strand:+ start:3588 stop:3995 length:408 start_codon:yes stop_codon:yes gene_type:complete
MEFDIRKLNPTDYDNTLVGWWKDWGWDAPAKDFLPDDGEGGLLVLDQDIPVCAGFIYITNSKVAWVDWIISNKNYKKKNKHEAVKLLVDRLTGLCKKSGSKYAYALIKHKGLVETYTELGYTKADNYTQEMIKAL